MAMQWVMVQGYVTTQGSGQPPRPDNTLPRPTPIPGWPDQGLPQPPPGIWGPNDPRPSLPIYIPITPPPGSGLEPTHPIYIPVYPDNALPGSQPGPDNSLPGYQPHPDNTLPGNQPRPDHGHLPYPDQGLPGGGADPRPVLIAKIKAVVDFWTGNLPVDPDAPDVPTPV